MRIVRLLNLNQSQVSRRTPAVILLAFAAAIAGLAAWGSARAQSTAAQQPATPRQVSIPTPPISSQIAQHLAAPHQGSVPTPPINSHSAASPADISMQDRADAQTEGEGNSDEILVSQRTPDLNCTFYDFKIENSVRQPLDHPGDCEGSTAGTEIYYCRQRDGDRLRQVQIGCKWKLQRLHDWELQQEELVRTACSKTRCN